MIPFAIPAKFLAGCLSGDLVRYGAILKDASNGQIVGHLQETGLVQNILQGGLSFDPTGATGLIGVVQNAGMSRQLSSMQESLGSVQGALGTVQYLQYATLFSSVAGIGVTAATSIMIMRRLDKLDDTLEVIEDRITDLPRKLRIPDLRSRLVDISTSVERLDEAALRSNPSDVVLHVERELHQSFNHIHDSLCTIVVKTKVDAGLVSALLAGLALCGASQFKALLFLDEKEVAMERSRMQCRKLEDLAFLMPRDEMASRLPEGGDLALAISRDCSEIRYRFASLPALARCLKDHGIDGREYVQTVLDEDSEPLLCLPERER